MLGPGPELPVPWGLLPQVDDLKAKLAIQEAELKQKNENADKLIHVVGVETEKVSKEKAIADEEEVKVEVINKVGRQLGFREQLPVSMQQGLPQVVWAKAEGVPNPTGPPGWRACLPGAWPPAQKRTIL